MTKAYRYQPESNTHLHLSTAFLIRGPLLEYFPSKVDNKTSPSSASRQGKLKCSSLTPRHLATHCHFALQTFLSHFSKSFSRWSNRNVSSALKVDLVCQALHFPLLCKQKQIARHDNVRRAFCGLGAPRTMTSRLKGNPSCVPSKFTILKFPTVDFADFD